jgi:UDP-GlcNAc:undecaprenyl-phosphate GlcNAc-1-phosphate transferase
MFENPVVRIAAVGFAVALSASLLAMPFCQALARRMGVVDRPGGRKTHAKVTPLLGGLGVFLGVVAGLAAVWVMSDQELPQGLGFPTIRYVMAGSVVLFVIGLVDDVYKDSMSFPPKLLGQIVGVLVLMWPNLAEMVTNGGRPDQWLYHLFLLGWYLTIVNSFNFSDNMDGLMSGLAVIAFGASILYLQDTDSIRTMMVAAILVGALVGFLPYNYPRSRVFLGDAGSMFIGFWMAWVQFAMVRGFMAGAATDLGASHVIPAVLIMGVPLYDAVFVVCMRFKEKRPVYLGDNHHLSHRLVRGGFSTSEAVFILWGLALILAWLGVFATTVRGRFRYMILGASVLFMVVLTRKIMQMERLGKITGASVDGGGESAAGDDAGADLDSPSRDSAQSAS